MSGLRQLLESLGLGQYADAFEAGAIDTEVLSELDHDVLKELGVTVLGHRLRILKAATALVAKSPGTAAAAPGEADPALERADGAERRQLTVMFCDVVDSTSLSTTLDPEDLRGLLRAYQASCAAIVSEFDGFVARYMGDGVLCYFGYPIAHENDAERAARAALALVERMDSPIEVPATQQVQRLSVRVGIATGLVVIGDLIGSGASQEVPVVGEIPNLAARLQALATPDAVVVSPDTRRLLEGRFRFVDLGPMSLRGLPKPVNAWQLVSEEAGSNRDEARPSAALVGRDDELDALLRRWHRACQGTGHSVVISGEPGIGKSELVRAFNRSLDDDDHTTIVYRGSPFHRDSALYPVVTHLEQAAGFSSDESAETKLAKLAELYGGLGLTDVHARGLVADLLSLPRSVQEAPVVMAPERRKGKTTEALLEMLEAQAHSQTVLCVFEDAHWLDPSSIELLQTLVERVREWPMLLLLTARPEFSPAWQGHAHSSLISLSRLPDDAARTLAIEAAGQALPAETLDVIVARSDGVPLFVEELTRSVVDAQVERDGSTETPARDAPVPLTLRDSLMARIDRLSKGRTTAQLGAVIGRAFPRDLVEAASELTSEDIEDAIAELLVSGLVSRRHTPGGEQLVFKHALVQEIAYDSLLRERRQALHQRVARALADSETSIVESEPETLARHYSEADQPAMAIPLWRAAAGRAAARAAHPEAVALLQRARELIEQMPNSTERHELEIETGLALVGSLRILGQYQDGLDELDRLQLLAECTEDKAYLSRVHGLRGRLYYPLGDYAAVYHEHQRSLEYARAADSTELEVSALGCIGDAHYARGRMRSAHEYFDLCVTLARRESLDSVLANHLPMRGMTFTFTNRLDDAREDYQATIEMATRLGELRCEMIALQGLSRLLLDQGLTEAAERASRRAVEVANRLGSRPFVPIFMTVRCRCLNALGRRDEALHLLAEADRLSEQAGRKTSGVRVFGTIAVLTGDAQERRDALEAAERLLARGSTGHNYYWFYRDAIDASLAGREWAEAERYAAELEKFAREEPVEWADFFVARGRALAAYGHGERGEDIVHRLVDVLQKARDSGYASMVAEIETVLHA